MVCPGVRRVAPILLAGALALPMVGGCGAAGGTGDSAARSSSQAIPTARMDPSAGPQTRDLQRGATGWVGGLRLGVGAASRDVGTVVVLAGRGVPPEGNWTVRGRAGHSRRLENGYTIRIDEVVNARRTGQGEAGPGGGSVTVTVTPPR